MTNSLAQPRNLMIDGLRGYALMGLFLIHMVEYFELYWYRPEPGWVNTVMFALFGGKAYAIFSLLFGVSFYIIMSRHAERGTDFRARFAWRLVLLFALGYLHGLVYGGDILQILAVAGLLLIPLYTCGNTTLVMAGLFFALQLPHLLALSLLNLLNINVYQAPMHSLLQPPVFEVYAHGSLAEVLRINMLEGQLGKWWFMIESGRLSNVIGLSVLGFWLGRIGFFTAMTNFRPIYWGAGLTALLLGLLMILIRPYLANTLQPTIAPWLWHHLLNDWHNHAWIALSICGFVLFYSAPFIGKILALLSPCGKITLTLYVGQSLLFVPLFYGYGLGGYNTFGQVNSLLLGILLWCLQVAFAHWWIRHYHYGPLEWLWRAGTLGNLAIPFRRAPA